MCICQLGTRHFLYWLSPYGVAMFKMRQLLFDPQLERLRRSHIEMLLLWFVFFLSVRSLVHKDVALPCASICCVYSLISGHTTRISAAALRLHYLEASISMRRFYVILTGMLPFGRHLRNGHCQWSYLGKYNGCHLSRTGDHGFKV